MSRLVPLALVAAPFVCVVDATPARAEPSFWTYAASAPPFISNGGVSAGAIGFIGQHGDPLHPYHHSRKVPLLLLVTPDQPDHTSFVIRNVQVPITVDIITFESRTKGPGGHPLPLEPNAWGMLTFTAMLNGTVNNSPHTSTLAMTFLGASTQSMDLDGNRYTVSVGPFHPFHWVPSSDPWPNGDPPGGHFLGRLDGSVGVSPVNVTDNPEPSGLALAGVGLVCAIGVYGRQRFRRVSLR